ncbi:hypothetical protein O6H91_Y567400 [Diphasiastrum complanatum]|nr:hypothetical protein O6H91_Y567400 [Diphasiastrum complanatum]
MGEDAASVTRQRKKRKWDQPAEAVPAALTLPTMLPFNAVSGLAAMGFPGMFAPVGMFPTLAATAALPSTAQAAPVLAAVQQQNAAAIVQKINQDLKGIIAQPKIQDELIAREIVINDAEPGIRYKLTKRQTQEEIQSKTGAVVITRGRFKPPSGLVDNEKPLYLHISAGVHLKDTAERIKAVDQAAAIVEEMLKQGRQSQSGPPAGPLSCGVGSSTLTSMIYVGSDTDASFNLVGRIRGPNDQYLNHIMKETGAIVMLKGRGSGSTDEASMPLHLQISCDNAKGLDNAKRLAENLLETIRSEHVLCRSSHYQVPSGAPHVLGQMAFPSITPGSLLTSFSPQPANVGPTGTVTASHSQPIYAAVPPPKQLLSDGTSISEEVRTGADGNSGALFASINKPTSELVRLSTNSKTASVPFEAYSSGIPASTLNYFQAGSSAVMSSYPSSSNQTYPFGTMPNCGQNFSSPIAHASATPAATTSYSGYGGIYPQVSPLQQVAMALQRPPPPLSVKGAGLGSSLGLSMKAPASSHPHPAKPQEKQSGQRRKFQEFPVSKEPSKDDQQQTMRAPVNTGVEETDHLDGLHESKGSLLPTLAYTKKELPAMSKFDKQDTTNGAGIKLVDYGEEDEEIVGSSLLSTPLTRPYGNGKPFWAP